MTVQLVALHGFNGQPDDWQEVKNHVGVLAQWWCPDLFLDSRFCPGLSLADWASRLAAEIQTLPQPRVLVGYSMGGRLALELLRQYSDLFSGAILISAHPPTLSESERVQRLKQDQLWAERFLTEDEEALLKAWNGQSVLANSKDLRRRSLTPELRSTLAQALVQWSVAQQENIEDSIRRLSMPVLWVAGEQDSKYAGLYRQLVALGWPGRFCQVAAAGHRVICDQPARLGQEIIDFIGNLDQACNAGKIVPGPNL